jgi:hypothetical protein
VPTCSLQGRPLSASPCILRVEVNG